MSTLRAEPGWADLLMDEAADPATGQRVVAQLRACQVSALAFCRLLERWARGDAAPSTPGAREAALRRAAERAETALVGLEQPLGRYLLELEAAARMRSAPSRSSLWAGLFDLRENLLGRAAEDLKALAA